MKLQVAFELPLGPESEPYLAMIARLHGYVEGGDQGLHDFVCSKICEPQVSSLFRSLVVSGLSGYLGASGVATIDSVAAQFDANHSVSATFIDSQS